jgi:DNA-binding PadR family transcriptional regulator
MEDTMGLKFNRLSPLTESTFYILLSLVKPLHGYGIIKKVDDMSTGRLKLAAGTLYGALNTLLNNKLIVLIGEDKENSRRKIYQITGLGEQLLKYEIKRLQEMLDNGILETGEKV